jgi:hypothetical protein
MKNKVISQALWALALGIFYLYKLLTIIKIASVIKSPL